MVYLCLPYVVIYQGFHLVIKAVILCAQHPVFHLLSTLAVIYTCIVRVRLFFKVILVQYLCQGTIL